MTAIHRLRAAALPAALVTLVLAAGTAHADPWGRRWDDAPLPPSGMSRGDDREGRVDVSRFVADPAAEAALGRGSVSVSTMPPGASSGPVLDDPGAARVFEAAVEDRLVHAGYDTLHSGIAPAQRAEIRVTREELVPAEGKRSPVHGAAEMSVGTGGMGYGLALGVDMRKPLKALVSTRLEARIVDAASGRVLWEGRAQIATRDGDGKWGDDAVASKLATALFDGFPSAR